MTMRVVWINKSPWKKPGPIVYMGLLNAMSMAWSGVRTDFFVTQGEPSDTVRDIGEFYGLVPDPLLTIHRVPEPRRHTRGVYASAMAHITSLCSVGEDVIVLTRELGCLPELFRIRRRFPGLRILHEAHDYFLTLAPRQQRGWSAWRRHWAERMLLPKCDGLVLLTDYQRALYQQWFPQLRMRALPLGTLSFTPADWEARRRRRCVAYVGHLHESKGSSLIVELAKRLHRNAVSLTCYGGSPAQVETFNARAASAGLERTMRFVPFLSPCKLHETLSSTASIGLVPLSDTFYNRYLTCPVKALDSLAHGLPVVATDLPGVRELLQGAGHYCTPDPDALAMQITTLLDDPQAYASATARSIARRSELEWSRRAAQILDLASTREPGSGQEA